MSKQPVPTTPKRDGGTGQFVEHMPRPQPLTEPTPAPKPDQSRS